MKIVCSWCGAVMFDPTSPNAQPYQGPISHGICISCLDKELAKLQEAKPCPEQVK